MKPVKIDDYMSAKKLSLAELSRRLGFDKPQNLNGHRQRGNYIVENSKGEIFCIPEKLRRAFL